MLSKEQYQHLSVALEQSFKKTCEMYKPVFQAINEFTRGETGKLLIRAIEKKNNIRGKNANR